MGGEAGVVEELFLDFNSFFPEIHCLSDACIFRNSFIWLSANPVIVFMMSFVNQYFLFNHASGNGITQIFIDLLSADNIADWITILDPSGLNVG